MALLDYNGNPIYTNEHNGIKSLMNQFFPSLRAQALTWGIGFVMTILAVFSDKIIENIKFSLNQADHRSKLYEELSRDLSEFIFIAELNIECLEKGQTETSPCYVIRKEYNDSITKLRKQEYVYLSWLKRFWKNRDVELFCEIVEKIKAFDSEYHTFNDEFGKPDISRKSLNTAMRMKKIFDPLKETIKKLLLESI